MKKKKRRPTKKQIQFSQRLALTVVIFSMGIVFYTITLNAILLYLFQVGMTEETVTTITTFGAITSTGGIGSYMALCGFRDNSKNKHGVTQLEYTNNNISEGENNYHE